jgi:hypothetical protein
MLKFLFATKKASRLDHEIQRRRRHPKKHSIVHHTLPKVINPKLPTAVIIERRKKERKYIYLTAHLSKYI